MVSTYLKNFNTLSTPQTEIASPNQVPNSAGGYSFPVDDWKRLERFLILGSEGGTYYIQERPLTKENAEAVIKCIQSDGVKAVNKVVEISNDGKAHKNSTALFTMALAITFGNQETKDLVVNTLPKVARTGTHLFEFLNYVKGQRGWGRALKRAVSNWYTSKDLDSLVYQTLKYRQREGWTHRDALRLAHPTPIDDTFNSYYRWLVGSAGDDITALKVNNPLLQSFINLKNCNDEKEAINIFKNNPSISWEMLPTQCLKSTKIWSTLLVHLPFTALLRNLGKLTSMDVIKPLSKEAEYVAGILTNKIILKNARIHPLSLLVALKAYQSGGKYTRKLDSSLKWNPVSTIVESLENAFYLSFDNIEPTNKRILLALDVSGSMGEGEVSGIMGLTPREASAVMAMAISKTEKNHQFMAFTNTFIRLNISSKNSLNDVMNKINIMNFGDTDCALPMNWALKNKVEVDCFVILTDNETWYDKENHPHQALVEYRKKMGIPTKLVTVGMVSNGFSLADPNDSGSLDVVGFSVDTPSVISDFIRD